MSHNITIRLSIDLHTKLEKAAHDLHRDKNWIINKALKEYLEACRQSLLASKTVSEEEKAWERNASFGDWK